MNHPASFGWTAYILGTCVREKGWLSLEAAVHKMTGMPAAKFRLAGRGLLRPGMAADVVLFDPAAIADNASFENPRRSPDGIRLVLVNGVPAVEEGQLQGVLAGGVIRP